MKHYGDITKINGATVEPVTVVIGGSPCQDLSVAGKQAGLAGERSGLFMEQLRIIKEMRRADLERGRNGKYTRPRYMVWENVPGAFSSNKGEDFGTVLQETAKVACEQAPAVPIPKNGWPPAGCLTDVGGQWSIAWRVFDAQFWGVPQRRRRIALVADFGGLTAAEILFERQGVSRNSAPSGEARERTAASVEGSVGTSGGTVTPTYCIQGICIDRADTAGCNGKGWTEDVSYTLNTIDRPAVCGFKANMGSKARGVGFEKDKAPTLSAVQHDASVCIAIENHPQDSRVKLSEDNVVQTLSGKMGTGGGNTPMVLNKVYALDRAPFNQGVSVVCAFHGQASESADISASESADTSASDTTIPAIMRSKQVDVCVDTVVRRLTPLECERLQGFPDGWTDIGEWIDTKGKVHKECSDNARYKALGNSIAIPPWTYVLQRLSLCCGVDPTMASLFDGIGGFPYIWESLNGKGSCVWASEIEEFPIAVTKRRFPEEVHSE